jgi:hypothetical protein
LWSRFGFRKEMTLPTKEISGEHSPLDSPHSSWFFSVVWKESRFAHHPSCDCYDRHLIRIGDLNLCLGCTCVAVGSLLAVLFLFGLWVSKALPSPLLSFPTTLAIGLTVFMPTLIQPFLQRKLFKLFSRTLLGMSVVLMFYAAIFLLPLTWEGVLLRGGFLAAFCATYRLTQNYRARYTVMPKGKCDKGCYPFCKGNRKRLEMIWQELLERADRDDPFLPFARALIDQKENLLATDGSRSNLDQ